MNDNDFIPSDDEEALYKPPKKLCDNMSPYLKVLPEFNELPESEDEDLKQMAKDLDDWLGFIQIRKNVDRFGS